VATLVFIACNAVYKPVITRPFNGSHTFTSVVRIIPPMYYSASSILFPILVLRTKLILLPPSLHLQLLKLPNI